MGLPALTRRSGCERTSRLSGGGHGTPFIGCRLVSSPSMTSGISVARPGVSWPNWRKRITVELHADIDGTEVRVRSSPKVSSMPHSYGDKDRRNVDYLGHAVSPDVRVHLGRPGG